jgi:hypothetical protein
MARTPPGRGPLAVGLLISLGAHVAALALVKLDVPEVSSTELEIVRAATPGRPAPPEPVMQVVEIRPPGMNLPSGGAGGGDRGGRPARAVDPGAAISLASSAPVPRASSTRGASTVSLAARAPVVPVLTVALAASPAGAEVDEQAQVARRPGRGVVLRGSGTSASEGSSARSRGATGRGLGTNSGGLTIVGPGGDCITPGASLPTLLQIPDQRPSNGAVARFAPPRIGRAR